MPKRYDVAGVIHELRHRRARRRPSGPPSLGVHARPLVSVVCVTNRPAQLDHVLATFDSQDWPRKELLIVANCTPFPHDQVVGDDRASIEIPADESLGACLNQGFATAKGELVVRFDDDDSYSPRYLSSVVETFRTVEAAVIGKLEYFAYVESRDEVIRLYEGRSQRYVGRVAGGTLAALREPTRNIRFPDTSLGEDLVYVRRCENAGLRVWASAPQGFLQLRRAAGDHTWQIDDDSFSRYGRLVGRGSAPDLWDHGYSPR